jgi:hypothetical protein
MLSAKTKGLFVEAGRFGLTVAVTSSCQPPFVVEKTVRVSPDLGRDKVRDLVLECGGVKKMKYARAVVGVYPQSRFVHRFSAETPAKLKEPNYLEEAIRGQLGVDLTTALASVVSAADGLPFDPAKSLAAQRDLVVCGASIAELGKRQTELQESGIYPLRMEMCSLSMLGAVLSLAKYAAVKRPVLLLEVDTDTTFVHIVSQDRVEFCRMVPMGLDSMLPILAGELGMKDENAARNMLYANTFDFTEMGQTLLGKLIKDVRATTGLFEVQTGQSIGSLCLHMVTPGLAWVGQSISKALSLEPVATDFRPWLETRGVKLSDTVAHDPNPGSLMGVVSLMLNLEPAKEA